MKTHALINNKSFKLEAKIENKKYYKTILVYLLLTISISCYSFYDDKLIDSTATAELKILSILDIDQMYKDSQKQQKPDVSYSHYRWLILEKENKLFIVTHELNSRGLSHQRFIVWDFKGKWQKTYKDIKYVNPVLRWFPPDKYETQGYDIKPDQKYEQMNPENFLNPIKEIFKKYSLPFPTTWYNTISYSDSFKLLFDNINPTVYEINTNKSDLTKFLVNIPKRLKRMVSSQLQLYGVIKDELLFPLVNASGFYTVNYKTSKVHYIDLVQEFIKKKIPMELDSYSEEPYLDQNETYPFITSENIYVIHEYRGKLYILQVKFSFMK